MGEDIYYLGFSTFSGVGPVKFSNLLKKFGSAQAAWVSPIAEVSEVIGKTWGERFENFRNTHNLEGYAESLQKKGIGYLCLFDEKYPRLLKNLEGERERKEGIEGREGLDKKTATFAPPFVLYYKGNAAILTERKPIAVVGTRKITDYGREVTQTFTSELVERDFVVVSGLAFGVDATAHRVCLEAEGKTIAVLGSGVDICVPSENQRIYDAILAKGGCIVSAVVPGERPIKGSFPARNRIIAGLSLGVLVTEGASDSGALITANFAKAFGRPVFAVPGPITSSLSKGPLSLIKSGATMVTNASEVLDSLGIMETRKAVSLKGKALRGGNKQEQEILDVLENGALHFDEIVRRMNKDSSTIGGLLSLMELKGMVRSTSDNKFTINY